MKNTKVSDSTLVAATNLVLAAKDGKREIQDIENGNILFGKLSGFTDKILGRNAGKRLYHLLHSYTHNSNAELTINMVDC